MWFGADLRTDTKKTSVQKRLDWNFNQSPGEASMNEEPHSLAHMLLPSFKSRLLVSSLRLLRISAESDGIVVVLQFRNIFEFVTHR